MKKMNKLTVAALALAAIGLASTAASAQVVTSAGDLILGFQITSAPNASPTDLEVDLGAQSLFTPTAVLNLSSKFSVTDLVNTFGSTWASNTNGVGVNWGAAATVGGTSYNKYNLDLTSTSAPAAVAYTSLSVPYGNIGGLTIGNGGISGATAAGTSTSALIGTSSAPASGITNSYTSQEGNLLNLNGNIEQTGAGSDELYEYVGGGGSNSKTPTIVDIGTFTLSSTGGLTFNGSQAVPEPSAYALGICAALLFLVLRRRASVL